MSEQIYVDWEGKEYRRYKDGDLKENVLYRCYYCDNFESKYISSLRRHLKNKHWNTSHAPYCNAEKLREDFGWVRIFINVLYL